MGLKLSCMSSSSSSSSQAIVKTDDNAEDSSSSSNNNNNNNNVQQKPSSKSSTPSSSSPSLLMMDPDLLVRLSSSWKDQEDGALLLESFKYLDVVTLIQKKSVSKKWQQICTKAIDNKCIDKKPFESKRELQQAVNKYSPGIYNDNAKICPPTDAEDIATTYGYPIDKWDVSNITDFSDIFYDRHHFNEPIGSWDVSNVTTMGSMFCRARSFNQDISSWDVSKVTNMSYMFFCARSFNQDISTWDVSNVEHFDGMFYYCKLNARRRLPWFKRSMLRC